MFENLFRRLLSVLLLASAIAMSPALPRPAEAQEGLLLQPFGDGPVIRLIRKGLLWYRVVDGVALATLTVEEARALGLDALDTTVMVVEVLIQNEIETLRQIADGGRYVTVEIIIPGAQNGLRYTREIVIPEGTEMALWIAQSAQDWLGDAQVFTTDVLMPQALDLAHKGKAGLEAGAAYTSDVLLPEASEIAEETAESVGRFLRSFDLF